MQALPQLLQRRREVLRNCIAPSPGGVMMHGRRVRDRRRRRHRRLTGPLLLRVVERSVVRLLVLLLLLLTLELLLALKLLLLCEVHLLLLLLRRSLRLHPRRRVRLLSLRRDVGYVVRVRRDLGRALSGLLRLCRVALLLREVLVVRLGVLVRPRRAALWSGGKAAVRSLGVDRKSVV